MNRHTNKGTSPLRIGIQGGLGSFHHKAVLKYFERHSLEIVPFESFSDLFYAIDLGEVDRAVVAMENSIAGFIHSNFQCLTTTRSRIVGEVLLRVHHCLLLNPDSTMEDIRELQSHPMAILQCTDYLEPLRKKGIRIAESSDTALSALYIAEEQQKHIAVIASEEAAMLYRLKIESRNIESAPENYTRFIVLQRNEFTAELEDSVNPAHETKSTIILELNDLVSELPLILNLLHRFDSTPTVLLQLTVKAKHDGTTLLLEFISSSRSRATEVILSIQSLGIEIKNIGSYDSYK